MSYRTKSRTLPLSGLKSGGLERSRTILKSTGKPGPWSANAVTPSAYRNWVGSQTTVSENHEWPPPKGSSGDVGGDFRSISQRGSKPASTVAGKTVNTAYTAQEIFEVEYSRHLSCPIELTASGTPKWPTAQDSSNSNLNALGATAISRCKPTSSAGELTTAIGELRKEGLPSLHGASTWEERTLTAKNAGSEFLNHQFGWLPLVSEVTSAATSVAKSGPILDQYRADRGNVIRRQYQFPVVEEKSETILNFNKFPDMGNGGISGGSQFPSTGGTWVRKTHITRKRWFSGAFIYGIPTGVKSVDDARNSAAEADKLLGLSLTPDVLWNLTPWSWAVDWVSNIGDVLSTAGDMLSQGLVMRYGYIMETSIHKVTYSLHGAIYKGRAVSVPDAVLTTTVKQRKAANPFGFGITWDGLSPIQGAILGALGISRRS